MKQNYKNKDRFSDLTDDELHRQLEITYGAGFAQWLRDQLPKGKNSANENTPD